MGCVVKIPASAANAMISAVKQWLIIHDFEAGIRTLEKQLAALQENGK